MHKLTRALVLLALAPSALRAQPAQVNGPLPGPLPLFPPDNWWNVDVRAAPVDPRSGEIIAFIGPGDGLHPDFGGDAAVAPEIYGMPYVVVPGDQPLERVAFVEFGGESDDGAPGRPPGYPIPPQAKSQPRWIEGGYPGNAGVGGDRHMLIVDRDHRLLFELWHTRWNAGPSSPPVSPTSRRGSRWSTRPPAPSGATAIPRAVPSSPCRTSMPSPVALSYRCG